jgi:hypothetical protein
MGASVRLICLLTLAYRAALIALALSLAGGWAHAAAQTGVDLQLVLAVDASGSVSEARFELQKQGYVAAFRSPLLLRAVRSGSRQAIAVTMVQWTGPVLQVQVVPWMLVNDEASMLALAAAIEAASRQLFGGGTSISGAIDHAMTLFPNAPYRGARRVIDVSGDGRNNRGRPAAEARDEAVRAGVTINGLPILAVEPDLEEVYRDNVIGGPGAFVIPAASFETFADAILKKLIVEISDAQGVRAASIIVAPRAASSALSSRALCPGSISPLALPRGWLDPGDKHRDDSAACGFPVPTYFRMLLEAEALRSSHGNPRRD